MPMNKFADAVPKYINKHAGELEFVSDIKMRADDDKPPIIEEIKKFPTIYLKETDVQLKPMISIIPVH